MTALERAPLDGLDVVSIRAQLLALESHPSANLREAASLWLAGLGGVARILAAPAGVDISDLPAKVVELFTVGLDRYLAAIDEQVRTALEAKVSSEIPHLGIANFQTDALTNLVLLIDRLRGVLRGEPADLARPLERLLRDARI